MKQLFMALLAGAWLLSPLSAADWTRFRGPNGMGISTSEIPEKLSEKENLLWKIEVPGVGHSSPIVVQNKIFLQSSNASGSKRYLYCFEGTTGKQLWSDSIDAQKTRTHSKNTLASSTAASDGQRVYTIFWDGRKLFLHAYDLAGKRLWHLDLGSYDSQHGAGMSPMVADGLVIVNNDQDGLAEVLAFDAKSGKKVWSQKRKAFRASPTTPMEITYGEDKKGLLITSTAGATIYDLKTGKELWDWTWKFKAKALRSVASPVIWNDQVLMTSGDGGGSREMVSVKLFGSSERTWELTAKAPYVPCPIIHEGHAYWVDDRGFASCVNMKTGKTVWYERCFSGGVTSSPLFIKGKILCLSEKGDIALFAAHPKEFDVSLSQLGESVMATPAIAEGKIYIRGTKHLFCFGKK